MKLSAYEWVQRAIDVHFREKALQKEYDYAGMFEFNSQPRNYQGDVVVIVIIPGEKWGYKRPTLRVDVYFGKSTDDYLWEYTDYADVVLRFRLNEAMKPNKGIEDYIQQNLLPLKDANEFKIEG